MTVAENFEEVRRRIRRAERKARREEGTTHLTAVTKTLNSNAIQAALATGQRLFGENKVQEAQDHWTELKNNHSDIRLHLIGPLQTNKVRDAVALFNCIETLDREKLAVALAQEMAGQNKKLPCFIQVNTGNERQKSGIAPEALNDFIGFCIEDQKLAIDGLMCIPPVDEPSALHFALLKKMAKANKLPNLSMGMSGDFEKAIALGATHIRLGTIIFGERP